MPVLDLGGLEIMTEHKEAIKTPVKTWDEYKAEQVAKDETPTLRDVLISLAKDLGCIALAYLGSMLVLSLVVIFVSPIIEYMLTFGITDWKDMVCMANVLFMAIVSFMTVQKMLNWIWEKPHAEKIK